MEYIETRFNRPTHLFFSVYLGRGVVRAITEVVGRIKDIAQGEGDLTKRLNMKTGDETGELADWFNTFLDKLHDIISRVRDNTDQVSEAVSTITSIWLTPSSITK